MAFFDRLKRDAANAVAGAVKNKAHSIGSKTENVVFADLPENLETFKALPQSALSSPFGTAALTIVALCMFPADRELCYQMLDYLRGPRPMNGKEKQFIADRFMDKDYVPRSYFAGASPDTDYMPTEPYT